MWAGPTSQAWTDGFQQSPVYYFCTLERNNCQICKMTKKLQLLVFFLFCFIFKQSKSVTSWHHDEVLCCRDALLCDANQQYYFKV